MYCCRIALKLAGRRLGGVRLNVSDSVPRVLMFGSRF